jgi:hypothetical protein
LGARFEGILGFVFVGTFVVLVGAGIGGFAMTEVMFPISSDSGNGNTLPGR